MHEPKITVIIQIFALWKMPPFFVTCFCQFDSRRFIGWLALVWTFVVQRNCSFDFSLSVYLMYECNEDHLSSIEPVDFCRLMSFGEQTTYFWCALIDAEVMWAELVVGMRDWLLKETLACVFRWWWKKVMGWFWVHWGEWKKQSTTINSSSPLFWTPIKWQQCSKKIEKLNRPVKIENNLRL